MKIKEISTLHQKVRTISICSMLLEAGQIAQIAGAAGGVERDDGLGGLDGGRTQEDHQDEGAIPGMRHAQVLSGWLGRRPRTVGFHGTGNPSPSRGPCPIALSLSRV